MAMATAAPPSTGQGRCVMYGQCGRKSAFSPPLNCPVDLPAVEPASPDFRARLVQKCGARYASGPVCCDAAQLGTLESSIQIAARFVAACPACWDNMQAFWCDFICHPDQASFLNVTATATLAPSGKQVVMGVDYAVDPAFATGFFDSCKDIKFGADNRFAMDFIGGGARTPQAFLDFMGAPKPEVGGSPFPIAFPAPSATALTPHGPPAAACNGSTGDAHRCSCVDCSPVCPVLPPLHNPLIPGGRPGLISELPDCGTWSCRAVAGAVIVLVLLAAWGTVLGTKVAARKWRRLRTRRRLAAAGSDGRRVESPTHGHDDEDERAQTRDDEERARLLDGPAADTEAQWPRGVKPVPGAEEDDSDASSEADSIEDELGHRSHPVSRGVVVGPGDIEIEVNVIRAPAPTSLVEAAFLRLGLACAHRPILTIVVALAVAAACAAGLVVTPHRVVTDPIDLWVPPASRAALAKAKFDEHFGPFYRTQQLFLTRANASDAASIVTEPAIRALFDLQAEIKSRSTFGGVSLADVCLHPLPAVPTPDGCVVQSITGYWQDDEAKFTASGPRWRAHLESCLANPAQSACLPKFNQPLRPDMVLDRDRRALIVTYVNVNARRADQPLVVERAEAWEAWLRDVLARRAGELRGGPANLQLAYSTESSIETEVARATSADTLIVAVSYVAMVGYIIATLRSATVGFTAVVLVLLSVGMAMGIMAWAAVPASFILLEVLPFLALAIGVDNVFLLVEALHAVRVFPTSQYRVAAALARQGPGFLLSFTCELLVFLAASLVEIPAVATFALYAATTLACLFFLQCTLFVAVLALIHVPELKHSAKPWTRYVRWLIRWRRALLATVAGVCLGSALLLAGNVQLGLDQREALPADSHLAAYFDGLEQHFDVGPPVYYMVLGADLRNFGDLADQCGRFADCRNVSLPNILEQERKRPSASFLASPPTAWLDDFAYWLQPPPAEDADDPFAMPACCSRRVGGNGYCDPETDDPADCTPCVAPGRWDPTSLRATLAAAGDLRPLLAQWLAASPSAACPQAGGAYADTVSLRGGGGGGDRVAFAFRAASVPLSNQTALIAALGAHTAVADEAARLTQRRDIDVYSVFHPFFAQYADLAALTWKLLGLAHLVVFAAAVVLLGSVRHAVVLVAALAVVVTLLAAAALGAAQVPLNGVSVVNLVMGTGLGVEFCVHVLRAYALATARAGGVGLTRTQRTARALVGAGASVLSGIGWTKLVGVAVLAFARSAIFRKYYFVMYLATLGAGLAGGLVVLPLFLLVAGDDDGAPTQGDTASSVAGGGRRDDPFDVPSTLSRRTGADAVTRIIRVPASPEAAGKGEDACCNGDAATAEGIFSGVPNGTAGPSSRAAPTPVPHLGAAHHHRGGVAKGKGKAKAKAKFEVGSLMLGGGDGSTASSASGR
ncbi:niemann-Pick type C- protein 1 [Blastocladiella emersonii ATCC 22665]|nr:niemann-Pick type C- protein 1 [Blastocladiella emersonii ATCC 22665]